MSTLRLRASIRDSGGVGGRRWLGEPHRPTRGKNPWKSAKDPNKVGVARSGGTLAGKGEQRPRWPRLERRVPVVPTPDRGELPRDPDADHLPPGLEKLEGKMVTVSGIDRATGKLVHLHGEVVAVPGLHGDLARRQGHSSQLGPTRRRRRSFRRERLRSLAPSR